MHTTGVPVDKSTTGCPSTDGGEQQHEPTGVQRQPAGLADGAEGHAGGVREAMPAELLAAEQGEHDG